MKKLKKNFNFLRYLSTCSPKQRKLLLDGADESQITCLCEICLNILKGNIPINVKKLKKYKKAIRILAKKSTSLKNKKKILKTQNGGFLPMVLPAILAAVAGFAGKALGKRI